MEIGFFKAVRSGIVKMILGGAKKKTRAQIDYQLNQLISKSIISEEVVDILGAVGLNKPNIAILSDEFLEEIKGIPQKNLAVELLKRLLEGRVKSVAGRNLVQSRKFSEMLEAAIRKYQNRAIETTQVILELIQLAREMNEMHRRGEETGLTEDELAVHSNRTISKEIIAEYFTAIKQKYNMLTPNDIENYAQVMFSRSMKS